MAAAPSTEGGTPSPGGQAAGRAVLTPETLEAVRRREPEALGQLFEACFGRVYSLAQRLMGNREAAEDVAQEVFLKVHKAAPQLDPSRDPGPWLAAITYNACREQWRSRGHRQSRDSDSINGDGALRDKLTNGRRDPERRVVNGERDAQVEQAIQRLPEAMRAVVLLHDYQGLSHDEVAGILGEGHAAVRKRYSRALAQLGDELKDVLG